MGLEAALENTTKNVGKHERRSVPVLTVDGILMLDDKIVLVKRKYPPYKNHWALPGGHVEFGETTEAASVREFSEETGLNTKVTALVGVYSDPNRDPRGHYVTVAYRLGLNGGSLKGGDDAKEAKWWQLSDLPPLAFDHSKIIEDARKSYKH